jgi:hypothetical protein
VTIAQVESLVVPGGEESAMDRWEILGLLVPHDDPGQVGGQARVAVRLVPHRRAALLDVALLEREDDEANVPVGAGLQAGKEVFVRVPGERAAIVPVDGERSAHDGSFLW